MTGCCCILAHFCSKHKAYIRKVRCIITPIVYIVVLFSCFKMKLFQILRIHKCVLVLLFVFLVSHIRSTQAVFKTYPYMNEYYTSSKIMFSVSFTEDSNNVSTNNTIWNFLSMLTFILTVKYIHIHIHIYACPFHSCTIGYLWYIRSESNGYIRSTNNVSRVNRHCKTHGS